MTDEILLVHDEGDRLAIRCYRGSEMVVEIALHDPLDVLGLATELLEAARRRLLASAPEPGGNDLVSES